MLQVKESCKGFAIDVADLVAVEINLLKRTVRDECLGRQNLKNDKNIGVETDP